MERRRQTLWVDNRVDTRPWSFPVPPQGVVHATRTAPFDLEFVHKSLSCEELRFVKQITHPGRRREWGAGRCVLKHLLRQVEPALVEREDREVTITSLNERGQGDRPRAFVDGRRLHASLSLSHHAGVVSAVAAQGDAVRFAVDLAGTLAVPAGVQRMWFDTKEQELACQDRENAARIWTTKEAAYKALQRGEPFCPRRVHVTAVSAEASTFEYRFGGKLQHGTAQLWHAAENVIGAFVFLPGASE